MVCKVYLCFKPSTYMCLQISTSIPTRSASNPNPTEPVLNQKLSLDYKEALDTLRLCSIEPVHDNCQDILDFILNHQTFQQLTSNTQVEDADSYPKAPNRYSTNYKMRKALKGVSGHTSVPKVQTNKLPVTEIPAKSNTVLSDATVLSTHNIPAKSTIKAYPSGVNSLVSYPTPHIKNSNISISQILATPTHEVPLDPEASASHTTTSSIPFIPDLKTKKIASTLANGLSARKGYLQCPFAFQKYDFEYHAAYDTSKDLRIDEWTRFKGC
ncbi:hypothetical protein CLU79DRAFT_719323 [Phycomyces nitens]|nr:hypothetical protein CLU79DRAFT_719323 [Phycomyces nitens]